MKGVGSLCFLHACAAPPRPPGPRARQEQIWKAVAPISPIPSAAVAPRRDGAKRLRHATRIPMEERDRRREPERHLSARFRQPIRNHRASPEAHSSEKHMLRNICLKLFKVVAVVICIGTATSACWGTRARRPLRRPLWRPRRLPRRAPRRSTLSSPPTSPAVTPRGDARAGASSTPRAAARPRRRLGRPSRGHSRASYRRRGRG
jgi:hypothetical protein